MADDLATSDDGWEMKERGSEFRRRAEVAEAHLRGLIRRRDTGGDDLLADLVTLIDVARASLLLEGKADAQPPPG
jgi:hypothetical protein